MTRSALTRCDTIPATLSARAGSRRPPRLVRPGGGIEVPDRPGFGVELNDVLVRAHPL